MTLGRFALLAVASPDAPGNATAGPAERLLGPGKPLALLAYLRAQRARRATRDQLVELLWSGGDPDRARNTLRQTVWLLRQRLGDDCIVADGDALVLGVAVDADWERFEGAVAAGDFTQAWALYAGDFIPDFAAPAAAGYEQWVELERDRLRAQWVHAGTALARTHLAAGRSAEAVAMLARLVEAAPERLDLWRLLIEERVAAGDRVQAQADAERLAATLVADGRQPDGELRALLRRIRSDVETPPSTAPDTVRRPDLVGREHALATLIAAWRRARQGKGTTCLVRGGAGIGKSRLLDEFRHRLTDLDATVVAVRPHPADHDVPFALAASMAEALAVLPGAAGVSPATAAALVGLAPALSSTFGGAAPAPTAQGDVPRVRTLAVMELLQCVAEESPLALVVDDLHWADEPSRLVLASVADRLRPLPVLLVAATRALAGGWPVAEDSPVLELGPLTPEQLQLLLGSVAQADAALLPALVHHVHEATGGIPLLVVAALELALVRGWLRVEDGRWVSRDLAALRTGLSHGGVLEGLLRDVPPDAVTALLAPALLAQPVDAALLEAVLRPVPAAPLVSALEQRGLLVAAGAGWDIMHDRLAEAVRAVAPLDQRRAVARRLADALQRAPVPTARALQQAGRLLHAVDGAEAGRLFTRWLRLRGRPVLWRDARRAASEYLGEGAAVDDVLRLARRVPAVRRLVHGWPVAAAGIGVVLVALLGTAAVPVMRRLAEPPAAALVFTEPPSSRGFLWVDLAQPVSLPEGPIALPARVAFRDRDGKDTRNGPREVRVRLRNGRGPVRLVGDTVLRPVRGEAVFSTLGVRGAGSFELEVAADGLPPVRSRRFYMLDAGRGPDVTVKPVEARLTIVGGRVNGQPVDSVRRTIRVAPGDTLDGVLALRAITEFFGATQLAIAVALWGERRSNHLALQALAPHGVDGYRMPLVERATGKRLVAPPAPGRYAIVFAHAAETEARFIASRTNWALREPVWNDGNDLADLTPSQLDSLERVGLVQTGVLTLDTIVRRRPVTYVRKDLLAGTVLHVVVEAPGR